MGLCVICDIGREMVMSGFKFVVNVVNCIIVLLKQILCGVFIIVVVIVYYYYCGIEIMFMYKCVQCIVS